MFELHSPLGHLTTTNMVFYMENTTFLYCLETFARKYMHDREFDEFVSNTKQHTHEIIE